MPLRLLIIAFPINQFVHFTSFHRLPPPAYPSPLRISRKSPCMARCAESRLAAREWDRGAQEPIRPCCAVATHRA